MLVDQSPDENAAQKIQATNVMTGPMMTGLMNVEAERCVILLSKWRGMIKVERMFALSQDIRSVPASGGSSSREDRATGIFCAVSR